MRTEQARPVRLDQYRPPDWLVETVELDVSLHSTATKVRATLKMSPNPQTAPAPIVLDGDGLTLTSLKLDGQVMRPDGYIATPDSLTIAQPPAGTCYLQIETLIDPSANTQLMGLYRSNGTYCTQCEGEGFRRITYFHDRPDSRDGGLHHRASKAEKSEASVCSPPTAILIESGDWPARTAHFAVGHDPFPSRLICFALVGGNLGCVEDKFVTMSGREVTLRIYVEQGKEEPLRLGDGFAQALDALGRRGVRAANTTSTSS
jgi:aminopeptidase N